MVTRCSYIFPISADVSYDIIFDGNSLSRDFSIQLQSFANSFVSLLSIEQTPKEGATRL